MLLPREERACRILCTWSQSTSILFAPILAGDGYSLLPLRGAYRLAILWCEVCQYQLRGWRFWFLRIWLFDYEYLFVWLAVRIIQSFLSVLSKFNLLLVVDSLTNDLYRARLRCRHSRWQFGGLAFRVFIIDLLFVKLGILLDFLIIC